MINKRETVRKRLKKEFKLDPKAVIKSAIHDYLIGIVDLNLSLVELDPDNSYQASVALDLYFEVVELQNFLNQNSGFDTTSFKDFITKPKVNHYQTLQQRETDWLYLAFEESQIEDLTYLRSSEELMLTKTRFVEYYNAIHGINCYSAFLMADGAFSRLGKEYEPYIKAQSVITPLLIEYFGAEMDEQQYLEELEHYIDQKLSVNQKMRANGYPDYNLGYETSEIATKRSKIYD